MENSNGKLIAAFLAGAAAGASLGLLLAPDKGKETRKKMKKSFDDLGSKAQDAFKKAEQAIDNLTKKKKTEEKGQA